MFQVLFFLAQHKQMSRPVQNATNRCVADAETKRDSVAGGKGQESMEAVPTLPLKASLINGNCSTIITLLKTENSWIGMVRNAMQACTLMRVAAASFLKTANMAK